jgi:hypothetical protein
MMESPQATLSPVNNAMTQPLGEVLQQAGLISAAQVQVALQDQQHYTDLRFGEILALRGWLKQETADFFADRWPILLAQNKQYPLGYWLKAAALLDDNQINLILNEQQQKMKERFIRTRFGRLIVSKGWLKKQTIDFFLESLSSKADMEEVFISNHARQTLF